MIKLLSVSWVQVFITFMPAYFRGCLFRNLYYVSMAFIWHGSHRAPSTPGARYFVRRQGLHAVTGVRKKKAERRRKRRLTLDEDDSNNYTAFSLQPPCSIHLSTVKREKRKPLSSFKRKKKKKKCEDVCQRKNPNEILMRGTEMYG